MATFGGAWVTDLHGFLEEVDEDYLRVHNRVGLGDRLSHPHGVTLLLPPAAARKAIVDEYNKCSSDKAACAIKNKLMSLIIPAGVSDKDWAVLQKAGFYVNAVGNQVAIKEKSGKTITLEGDAKAEPTKESSFFRCNREGVTDSVYFVYDISKMPADGKPTETKMRSLLAEPVGGGADTANETSVEVWFCNALQEFGKLMAAGNHSAAHSYVQQIMMKWYSIVLAKNSKDMPESRVLEIVMAAPPTESGTISASMQMWALLWLVIRPDAPNFSSLTTEEFRALTAEVNVSNTNEVQNLQRVDLIRANFLCGEPGDSSEKMMERYDALQKVNAAMKSALNNAANILDACAVINDGIKKFFASTSNRMKDALARNPKAVDDLFVSLVLMSDMRIIAKEHTNKATWEALRDRKCAPEFAMLCARSTLYPLSLNGNLSEDWLQVMKTINFDALIATSPGAVQGGNAVAPSLALVNAMRAWSTFGGGDLDALVSAVRSDSA